MSTYVRPTAILDLGVLISLFRNGNPMPVLSRGELGKLNAGDKIVIKISVANGVEHDCYVLNSKLEPVNKKSEATSGGMAYSKNFTVQAQEDMRGNRTRIAGFPNNMVCLKLGDKEFSIGIVVQDDRYYFVIEERQIPVRSGDLLTGTVLSCSLLRGTAVIYTGSFCDAKVHWTNMPSRKEIGLRALFPGEVISWNEDDVVPPVDQASQFIFEIKRCAFV